MTDLILKQGTSYTTAEGATDDWGEAHVGGTYNLGGTANITASGPGVDTQLDATIDWPAPSFTLETKDT